MRILCLQSPVVRIATLAFRLTSTLAMLAPDARAQERVRRTTAEHPFGTLREQATMQQAWLQKRLDTFLPALMRKHGIDLWVVPMREYNEDPVFSSISAPETFAARRRTIYVFFDRCASTGAAPGAACVERIALGGTSQGGVFAARRSVKSVSAAVNGRQASRTIGLTRTSPRQAITASTTEISIDIASETGSNHCRLRPVGGAGAAVTVAGGIAGWGSTTSTNLGA